MNNSKINFLKIYKLFILNIFFLLLIIIKYKKRQKLKIGVVGLRHEINVGNNLVKYSISILLKKLGFIPYIIGTHWHNFNISFLNRTTNLIVIQKNFTELKKDDFDILMVNSDQTWNKYGDHILNYGFLKFAKNWNIKKFVYAASLGYNSWPLSYNEEKIAKELLNNFTGISIREQNSVHLIKKHFGIIPEFALDPTLLIDKKYYLDLTKNYPKNRNINGNYIFVYNLLSTTKVKSFSSKVSNELNYTIYEFILNNTNPIEDFIYYISNCKAVISNSYHGTIFSIIFNKPFISFCNKENDLRFESLGNLLDLKYRFASYNDIDPDISLLTIPLNLNISLIESLKSKSIHFIKKNLGLK
jgi:hypothetical protein